MSPAGLHIAVQVWQSFIIGTDMVAGRGKKRIRTVIGYICKMVSDRHLAQVSVL